MPFSNIISNKHNAVVSRDMQISLYVDNIITGCDTEDAATKKHEPLCPAGCSTFVVGPPTVTKLVPKLFKTRLLMITTLLMY